MNTSENLRAAMRAAGLDYPGPITADGRLHRFRAEGDRERNSWFVIHPGPPAAGAFGCWKRGLKENWCERTAKHFSPAEWRTVRAKWIEAEAERERTEAGRQAKAREVAAWILRNAGPADGNAYLASKSVHPCGELRQWRGALVVPLRAVAGERHSLQFIGPDGSKRFLTAGRVAGCFFSVAEKPDGALVICEGVATGASVFEATKFATVAALNAGNLKVVAEALRAKWPEREIIVAGDNDQFTDGNPGLSKSREVALAIGARQAVPKFADTATKPTDFNDLHQLQGLDTVKQQIEGAELPKESDAEAFQRLAKLPPLEYERRRKDATAALGIDRVAILDAEVENRRTPTAQTGQGTAVDLPTPDPWPDPVDGAEVLATAADVFSCYVALPAGAADALALWVAHAHTYEAFVHSPRLNLWSPRKRLRQNAGARRGRVAGASRSANRVNHSRCAFPPGGGPQADLATRRSGLVPE